MITKKERAKIKAELRAEVKAKKLKPTDGLGPKEVRAIRDALRLVWQRSHAWRLVKKRCLDKDGFPVCEKCNKRTPKIHVDHKRACGSPLDPGYLERLMVPSKQLQGLCGDCHSPKTQKERKAAKKQKQDWGF